MTLSRDSRVLPRVIYESVARDIWSETGEHVEVAAGADPGGDVLTLRALAARQTHGSSVVDRG